MNKQNAENAEQSAEKPKKKEVYKQRQVRIPPSLLSRAQLVVRRHNLKVAETGEGKDISISSLVRAGLSAVVASMEREQEKMD